LGRAGIFVPDIPSGTSGVPICLPSGAVIIIAAMAKSVAKIRFEPRPIKVGPGWMVVVTFPDRPEIEVPDFATEADAKNWITNDSWAWLKKLGYGD
jgi:hypothetical protein